MAGRQRTVRGGCRRACHAGGVGGGQTYAAVDRPGGCWCQAGGGSGVGSQGEQVGKCPARAVLPPKTSSANMAPPFAISSPASGQALGSVDATAPASAW